MVSAADGTGSPPKADRPGRHSAGDSGEMSFTLSGLGAPGKVDHKIRETQEGLMRKPPLTHRLRLSRPPHSYPCPQV